MPGQINVKFSRDHLFETSGATCLMIEGHIPGQFTVFSNTTVRTQCLAMPSHGTRPPYYTLMRHYILCLNSS